MNYCDCLTCNSGALAKEPKRSQKGVKKGAEKVSDKVSDNVSDKMSDNAKTYHRNVSEDTEMKQVMKQD